MNIWAQSDIIALFLHLTFHALTTNFRRKHSDCKWSRVTSCLLNNGANNNRMDEKCFWYGIAFITTDHYKIWKYFIIWATEIFDIQSMTKDILETNNWFHRNRVQLVCNINVVLIYHKLSILTRILITKTVDLSVVF